MVALGESSPASQPSAGLRGFRGLSGWGFMKQIPGRTHHDHAGAGAAAQVAGPPGSEDLGQQLIGWRLFVCFAIGAGLWLGVLQLVASAVPEPGVWGRILSAIRFAVVFVGVISLALTAMAGLNELLRRVGPDGGRGSRRRSARSSPSGAGGHLS